MMRGPKRIDLTGQVFGRLRVLGYAYTGTSGSAYWHCECQHDNGTKVVKVIRGGNLTNKKQPTLSCGCLRGENAGYKSTPNYQKSLNSRPTKDALRHLYWGLNMSLSKIVAYYREHNPEYAPAVSTVGAWLRYYDIPARDRSISQKLSFKVNPSRAAAFERAKLKYQQDKKQKGECINPDNFRTNPAKHKKAINAAIKVRKAKVKLRHAAAAAQQMAHTEMEAILNGETSRF